MSYTAFRNKWLGKRVNYDGIYGYQCVDLIKQYAHEEYGIKAGAWGNAIDYWYNTHPDILKGYSKLSTKEARIGDVVVLKGVNGNPYGHVGIANKSAGWSTVQILEQNGSTGSGSGTGGDAIRLRSVPKWRVVGVLRPKVAKPSAQMPAVGSKIKIHQGVTRNTYKAGTTRKAGSIYARDNTYIYFVRGYDPVYGGRILINSKSGGGNGVALALYYWDGNRIEGWNAV